MTEHHTVLVVDDAADVRQLVTIVLADEGSAVVEAHDAESALRFARTLPFNAVLLDQMMPGPQGTDILPELRRLLPEARIVMFSCDESCHRLSLQLGADEFVRKDSPIEQLIDHLRPAVA
jgi:DNA-binding response OmpR family regulator